MLNKIFFVTGVCGVGKTTIISPLTSLLGVGFHVHDFDEEGVPNNVDRSWRLQKTQHWIDLGLQNLKKNISTIICGFTKPDEVHHDCVVLILLDAEKQTIEKRLWNRYQTPQSVSIIEKITAKPVQKFIDDNVYYSSIMRDIAQKHNLKIIDTTRLSPTQVANEVAEYVMAY